MPWQNEMSIIVRHLVNDVDSSSYTFIDDRKEETILVSAQLLLHEVDFENKKDDKSYSYSGACHQTLQNENQGGELGNGLGVVFSTGIGDGSYPVYAYLGEIDGFGERVLKVEIDFNDHVLLD